MNNEITLPLSEVKATLTGLGKVVSRTHSLPIVQKMVGAPGFKPGTSCAQGRRAIKLRYAPTGGRVCQ